MEEIREYEKQLLTKPPEYFEQNHKTVKAKVTMVEDRLRKSGMCEIDGLKHMSM